MNTAQTTLHSDARTGEILNASILINANLISVQYVDRIAATVATDPRVRTVIFPQEVQGELIQAAIAQAVGTGLGLNAVSYTHLDVYKRQRYGRCFISMFCVCLLLLWR